MGLIWKNGLKQHGTKRLNGVEYIALEVSDSKYNNNLVAEPDLQEEGLKPSQLRAGAIAVSWVSVIFSFCTGVAAVALGNIYSSESLFGYGLDSVLDSLSSVAVIWRFYGSTSSTVAEARERKACIVISVFFYASACSLIAKSSLALVRGDRDSEEGSRLLILIFSSITGTVALVLASLKVYLGTRLDSRSLLTDSIITYVGAVMSFLGVLGMELYRVNDDIWYLDAAFGLACGIFLAFFGVKLMISMTCMYTKHKGLEEESE